MSRVLVSAIFAAAAMIGSVSTATAQETRLLFSSMSPAGSNNSNFFNEWAQEVSQQSDGTLAVEVRDGTTIANFGNVYDRVGDDVIQIGWSIHQVVAGRFPLSEVAGVPTVATGGPAASVSLWQLYESGALDSEYEDVVPIFYAVLPGAFLHFAEAPASVETLSGVRVGVSGRFPSEVVSAMGGTPVSMNSGEMYEAMQRGTVDAIAVSWGAFLPYNLHEVTSYHLEVPLGQSTSMFFMARAKFDALPQEARDALMANGGDEGSRRGGEFWFSESASVREQIMADPEHEIVELDAEQAAVWNEKIEPIVERWTAERGEAGAEIREAFTQIYQQQAD